MEELVELVSKKTGIPKETAEKAVKIVIDYLKKKLPAPIADRLEGVLENDSLDDILGGLGGLLK